MPSYDDYKQNDEMMKAGENLANELVELINEKYQDNSILSRRKYIFGGEYRHLNEHRFSKTLKSKIQALLNLTNTDEAIVDDIEKLAVEIFTIIKGNYSANSEKMQLYLSVLSDDDAANTFIDALCH